MKTEEENIKSLSAVLGEALNRQPWELPAWRGDVQGYGNEVIFKMQMARKDTMPNDPLHVWEYPHPKCGYLVAVDPSSGMPGRDPAAIQIVRHGGVQVAEMIIDDRSPEDQLRIAVWLCEFYNNATLAIEVNGAPGAYMMERLRYINTYKNLWMDPWTHRIGYLNGKKSREHVIHFLQENLKSGYGMMRSLRMREQFDSFEQGGRADDNLVQAYLIAHYCAFNHGYTTRWDVKE